MPSCRITNHTDTNLNIALKQVTALYFENEVEPGATIKFTVGVWISVMNPLVLDLMATNAAGQSMVYRGSVAG